MDKKSVKAIVLYHSFAFVAKILPETGYGSPESLMLKILNQFILIQNHYVVLSFFDYFQALPRCFFKPINMTTIDCPLSKSKIYNLNTKRTKNTTSERLWFNSFIKYIFEWFFRGNSSFSRVLHVSPLFL